MRRRHHNSVAALQHFHRHLRGRVIMLIFTQKLSSRLRVVLIAFAALISLSAVAVSPAEAATGHIRFSVLKGGWFIGASGGSGTLTFQGRSYPISIGGLSAGLVFGASETRFSGTVSNIHRASDVAGVYGAIGAGGAVVAGAQVIRLRNARGALLTLSGRQV